MVQILWRILLRPPTSLLLIFAFLYKCSKLFCSTLALAPSTPEVILRCIDVQWVMGRWAICPPMTDTHASRSGKKPKLPRNFYNFGLPFSCLPPVFFMFIIESFK